MNCPSCGAPMQLKPDMESLKCPYCLSTYFPEKNSDDVRVLDEPVDEECPLCNLQLARAVFAKCPILYCKKCGGMLVAMGALEALIEELRAESGATAAPKPPDPDDLRRTIACPHCHRRMDAHFYGGPGNVVIDSCEECAMIWLDRGEAMRIARAVDGGAPRDFSFSDDSSAQSDVNWTGVQDRAANGILVDGVIDSFLR